MAKKQVLDKDLESLKKVLGSGKIIMGTERSMKALKDSRLESLYLSSNCPGGISEDITRYSSANKTKVIKLHYPNDELGVLCKKPFSISMVGVLK